MEINIIPLYTVQINASSNKWPFFYARIGEEGKKDEIKTTLHFLDKDKAEQYVIFVIQWLQMDKRTQDLEVYLEDTQIDFLCM